MLSAFADLGAKGCDMVDVCSDSFGLLDVDIRGGERMATLIVGGFVSVWVGGPDMQDVSTEMQVSMF